MADTNHKWNFSHDEPGDELDRALDQALAKYSAVEPRTGLEERILANLSAEQTRLAGRVWWRWGAAAAFAVMVVAVTIVWRSGRTSQPLIVNHPTVEHSSGPEQRVAKREENASPPSIRQATRQRFEHRSRSTQTVAANPKLEVFPSPQPLSAEEIALTQYVKNFPKEAQLVAQAQEQFELDTEKEMNDAGSETRPSGSIQQER